MDILIYEPHHRMRWLLVDMLHVAFAPTRLLEAPDAAAARKLCREIRPKLVLVSLGLDEAASISLVADIVAELPEARVVVLAEQASVAAQHAARRVGAAAFLSKDEIFGRLLAELRQVLEIPHDHAARTADDRKAE
jgi:DNA-binding NarL/FixJ family response regulator